jgi:hypothetical protein
VRFARVSDVDGLVTELLAAPFMFLAAASCRHTNSHTSKIMSIIPKKKLHSLCAGWRNREWSGFKLKIVLF